MSGLNVPAPIDNDGSSVIEREAVISEKRAGTESEVLDIYEVERTVEVINAGDYKRVALQFPDDLLADSTPVADALSARTNAKIFILADTSYGSCCVDEVASEHYSADLIVHYGNTCLTLTTRIPVYYVFGRPTIDIEDCISKVTTELHDKNVLLMYDVGYTYASDDIAERLRASHAFGSVIKSTISASNRPYIPKNLTGSSSRKSCSGGGNGDGCCGGCNKSEDRNGSTESKPSNSSTNNDDNSNYNDSDSGIVPGRSYALDPNTSIGDYTILYIGGESLALTNIMLTCRSEAIFSYTPETKSLREESAKVNRHLNRRYFMVQKAKDADVIGILVGTLAATRYLSVVESLKKLIRKEQKKFYVFVIGKLNVAKLANFPEIDLFVMVACPENSLIDSKEFYQPIVTPYELQLSLSRTREWTGDYITDFQDLLVQINQDIEEKKDDSYNDDEPHFSLVTGKLKQNKRYNPSIDALSDNIHDLTVRDQNSEIIQYMGSAAAERFQNRSFKGLGQDEDSNDPEPMLAVEGKSGIARGYAHEKDL